jgi:glutamate dehydrogenase/leucine dehydrogenase
VLHERGVLVLPDFIVNSGGIIAAFVEMTSNVSNEENKKTKKKVLEAKATTRAKVRDNVMQVLNLTDSFRLEPSVAARYLALTRIFASI